MTTKADSNEKTVSDLDQEIAELQALRKKKIESGRREDLEEIRRLINRHGFKEEDLGFAKQRKEGKRSGKSKVPPKYRHPNDPNTTWSGRGISPGWYKDHLVKGNTRESMLIDKSI